MAFMKLHFDFDDFFRFPLTELFEITDSYEIMVVLYLKALLNLLNLLAYNRFSSFEIDLENKTIPTR